MIVLAHSTSLRARPEPVEWGRLCERFCPGFCETTKDATTAAALIRNTDAIAAWQKLKKCREKGRARYSSAYSACFVVEKNVSEEQG
jgi:hypothetical protein